jgi:hypothetical protein
MKKYNEFLLEKRIDQISTSVEVTFSIDVIKTIHTDDRHDFDKRGLNIENIGKISNLEMKEFVHFFETYKELKGEKKRFSFNSELFHEFYNLYHRNQRQAYLIRKLAHKDYKMLHVFLMEFSSFDWEDIQKHMEEVGWKWYNSKETPTIEMLKNAVIELISFDFNKIGNVESGGFSVGLYYTEEGEPFCEIKFDKEGHLC